MKLFALLLFAISGAAMAAEPHHMNGAERMQMLQEMQHRRPDAENYVNNLQKQENAQQEQGISFKAGDKGHFYLPVTINGNRLDMMADTGATDIFISMQDAQKMGINFGSLQFNIPYNTANGTVYAAETKVKSLAVGDIVLNDVPVTVSQNRNNDMSLLGMAFFSRLKKYDVNNGVLTLYK